MAPGVDCSPWRSFCSWLPPRDAGQDFHAAWKHFLSQLGGEGIGLNYCVRHPPEINVIKFPNRSDLLLERWRCKDDIELFRWRITLQMDCFFFCLNCPEIYRCCQLQAFFVSYIEFFTWNQRCSEQISQVALFLQKPECRARWRRVKQPPPPLCCANLQPSSCASEANRWSSLQTFWFLS